MTDEERKAIDYLQLCYDLYTITNESLSKLGIVLNLIEKQSKEIEHQIEKRANQKKELAILNAKQVEFNKLVNTVNSYKGQFKRQQKEIEELKEDLKKKPTFLIKDIYSPKIKEISLQDIEGLIEQGREEVKDKIKAKIEEIDKVLNEDIYVIDGHYDDRYYRYLQDKHILQSLLEKE